MKFDNEISLSKDEFDFSLCWMTKLFLFIKKLRENNDEHENEIRDIRRIIIRIRRRIII